MPISSNTLFHFTNSLDHVFSILSHEFHPHFSLEDYNVISPRSRKYPSLVFAVPMVSFCDIPLSQTAPHLAFYGKYGVGMRKEWAIKRSIVPVLYAYRGSRLARYLYSLAVAINRIPKREQKAKTAQDYFYDLSCFVKPYEGGGYRQGRRIRKRRFYDEREWRYVPRLTKDFYRYGMPVDAFRDDQQRTSANAYLWTRNALSFVPKDVKYIIVSSESEILGAIQHIETAKSRFPRDEVRTLISRIVSASQIAEDF